MIKEELQSGVEAANELAADYQKRAYSLCVTILMQLLLRELDVSETCLLTLLFMHLCHLTAIILYVGQ